MFVSSCSRSSIPNILRLAIPPANVLVGDVSSEWLRLAVPLVLQRDLATSAGLAASMAEDESSVYRLGATETLRVTIQERSGKFEIDSALSNVSTQRSTKAISVRGPDLLSDLNSLAKQIDGQAAEFSTRSDRALKAFSAAVSAADIQVKTRRLRDAIEADPSFGAAYCALIDTLAGVHSSDTATVLNQGESRRASFTALDRAQFDLLRAKLLPAALGDQAKSAAALVKLTPNDPEALAALGSLLFLQGQLEEAERMMARAIQISPNNPVLQQQLAFGLMENRQFARAEKVFSSLSANPAGIAQLAFCVLLDGDVSRANEIYAKFLTTVPNPAGKTFLQAAWQAFTGHLDEAIHQLGAGQFSDSHLTLLAKNQIVLWQIMANRHDDAQMTASSAGPMAKLLAEGAPNADAWRSKVDAFPERNARDSLRAYGLFLHGFYNQAAESWKAIADASGDTDLRARAMLAASLRLAGKPQEARRILVQPFVPDLSGYYAAVSFAQLRSLLVQAG